MEGIMEEGQAGQRIRIAYARLGRSQESFYDTDTDDDDQVVTYHINAIRTAGGGQWNNVIAKEYVTNLESQLEEEIITNDRHDDDGVEDVLDQRYDRTM